MPGILLAVGMAMGYALGSINFSLIAARMGHFDIRGGSGNPGATNVWRQGGWAPALLVLCADWARAALGTWVALRVAPHWAPWWIGALFAGNLYPIFHRFRGGKGVAMTMGIWAALCPPAAGVALAALAIVLAIFRRMSPGSLAFVWTAPAAAWFLQAPRPTWLLGVLLAALVTWRHRGNIHRLMRGAEPRIF